MPGIPITLPTPTSIGPPTQITHAALFGSDPLLTPAQLAQVINKRDLQLDGTENLDYIVIFVDGVQKAIIRAK
jgi:hypothetical protein